MTSGLTILEVLISILTIFVVCLTTYMELTTGAYY